MKHENTIPIGGAMTGPREQMAQIVAAAASSTPFKWTAAGTGVAGFGEWVLSSHGLATVGVLIALMGFVVNVVSVWRRNLLDTRKDRREQREYEARMKSLGADP